jgi:sterol desaturase/sphingolipid hydroxylase (fatty acid hydroxylase superfamily)
MINWSELARNHFIDNVVERAPGAIALGLGTVLVIGSLYFVVIERRQGEPVTIKGIFAFIFPRQNYSHPTARVDRISYVVNVFGAIPFSNMIFQVAGLMIGLSFAGMLAGTFGATIVPSLPGWATVAVQFLGAYLGLHFLEYWMHYAMHRVPLLWSIHRAHHSAERLNLFTIGRGHPLEELLLGAARIVGAAIGGGLALYATGGTLMAETTLVQLYVGTTLGAIGWFGHLHIPISYGRFLNHLLPAPVLHQIHHSAELRHRDKNMGHPFFDWMFGTLYLPRPNDEYRWGLNDDELGANNPHNSLGNFYLEPFRALGAALRPRPRGAEAAADRTAER